VAVTGLFAIGVRKDEDDEDADENAEVSPPHPSILNVERVNAPAL
jgi:hypothetical protein